MKGLYRMTRLVRRARGRPLAAALILVHLLSLFAAAPALAGPYVTDASALRWNDVGGLRWNDVGGLRWNDVGGLRWNDVGGLRWNDVGGLLWSDATGLHWNDPGGLRWNDVGALVFDGAQQTGITDIDLDLLSRLQFLPDTSWLNVIVTYRAAPTALDLPFGSKVVGNVRLAPALGAGIGFTYPLNVEGLADTDLVLGHGTFVASVAAGTGQASGGTYRGVAPGASILGLSAGDVFIVNVLEGFDYVLQNAARYGVRVVNCSWGTQGWFDPDDPVNIATRLVHDTGITVVFAVGNQGPSPDTLNPYAVAPWVIGVGSSRKDGRLSRFSSRGLFEELLCPPTPLAPGAPIP